MIHAASRPRRRPCRLRLLSLVAVLGALAWSAAEPRASVICSEVGLPAEGRVEIEIEILQPLPGQVFQVENTCSVEVELSGSYSVLADYESLYDFYVVFDSSGSTSGLSGSDVDGNGSDTDLPQDSIHHAEITAAQRFIEALDPATSRVAVIGFSGVAINHVTLTADLPGAVSSLERLKSEPPGGGTLYSVALAELERVVLTDGDLAGRVQRALFLSDGEPNAGDIPLIAPAAERLAAIPVRIDTFALAVPDAAELRNIADITSGFFTLLLNPGDILDVLPRSASDPGFSMDSANQTTRTDVPVDWLGDETGTFSATMTLQPGPNRLEVGISVPGTPDTVLTCTVEVSLDVTPGPSAIGSTLRVSKSPAGEPVLQWTAAPDLRINDGDLVTRSEVANALFPIVAGGLLDRTFTDTEALAPLLFYDVRRSNCEFIISED